MRRIPWPYASLGNIWRKIFGVTWLIHHIFAHLYARIRKIIHQLSQPINGWSLEKNIHMLSSYWKWRVITKFKKKIVSEWIISYKQQNMVLYSLLNSLQFNALTVLYTFPKELTRRICLIIKSCFTWWSFPLFSWPQCLIQGWYCKERINASKLILRVNRLLISIIPFLLVINSNFCGTKVIKTDV